MVHRRKHNEHFLTLIDHGTVPWCERMPRVLGALTVSYNSSVNWLERCFDYHYDCDSYAWNVFNSVSYITYLLRQGYFTHSLSSRRTICQFYARMRIQQFYWTWPPYFTILFKVCNFSPKIYFTRSLLSSEGRLTIPSRTCPHTWSLIQPFY